jgi:hypothetical protein
MQEGKLDTLVCQFALIWPIPLVVKSEPVDDFPSLGLRKALKLGQPRIVWDKAGALTFLFFLLGSLSRLGFHCGTLRS